MVLAASGLLDKADWSVSDAWYQSRGAQPPLSRPSLNGWVSLPAVTSVPIGVSRLLQNSRSLIRQRAWQEEPGRIFP